jgi:hypothetical protein
MYQLLDIDAILRLSDNICIPRDDGNVDYQEYQHWLAEENQPLPYVPPPVVEPPDWDGLNQAIMANAEFNQAYATVMQTYPLVAAALPAALTQVASGQASMFETTFLAMCQIAQVSPEQRAIWADIGATYNAPQDFLDIVRGNNG